MKKSMVPGLILSVAGLISTLVFATLVIQTTFFIAQSKKTTGKVSDMVIRSSKASDGTTVQAAYPVIRYQDNKGNELEFELPASQAHKYRIGQRVPIRYIPGHDPKSSRINGTFLQTWGSILLLGLISLILDSIGLPLLIHAKSTIRK
ncbi:MAG TPA: DUF3592 domain-containing protein [Chitinispirillaceae bacterium]|nr:DUF3592 domain-containing protein [Chitinispirillaceae bacterium]